MRIAVVGPGAIGCLFGGMLSMAGHEVWLVDRHPQRARLLARRGILVSGVSGEFRAQVHATASPPEAAPAELVIVAVKSFDTAGAAGAARQVLSPETPVLTLQNGLGNVEVLQQELGGDRVLGGVTAHGANVVAPGHINHAGMGLTIIGDPSGVISERLLALKDVLSAAGLQTEISADLSSVIWGKLVVNAGVNALATVERVRNGGIMESAALRGVLRAAVSEACAVAEAKGVTLPYADMQAHAEEICQRTANNVNSMLQDVLRRRRTEVEAINGAVVREGKAADVPTPTNEVLLALMQGIEQTYSARLTN